MKKLFVLFIFSFFLEISSKAICQEISIFKRSDGLVDNSVLTILQSDQPKNIWIGTPEGIGIYDFKELKWQPFEQNDELTSRKVFTILQAENEFWFGTDKGATIFDGSTLYPFPGDSISCAVYPSNVTCLYLDSKNNVWIGTYQQGLFKYQRNSKICDHYYNEAPGLNKIRAISEDQSGNLWIGTQDSGICIYGRDSLWTHYFQSSKIGNRINVIYRDKFDTLWIGTNNGISYGTNCSDLNRIECAVGSQVTAITEDRENNIWFGTNNGQLYFYDRISCQRSLVQLPNAPPITGMILDSLGYLWIGTLENGIYRLHLNWRVFNKSNSGIEDNFINDIVEDHQGNLWIATDNKYLFKYQNRKFEKFEVYTRIEGMNEVNSVIVDQENWLWCGTNNGAFRFDQISEWIPFMKPDSNLASNMVNVVFEDHQGDIWLGTTSGVSVYDGKYCRIENKIPAKNISVIYEDHNGHLWFGISGDGVLEFNRDSILTVVNSSNYLLDDYVFSITQDQNNLYWFGSSDGITIWDREQDTTFYVTEHNFLHHNHIQCFFKDRQNNIWIGTKDGGLEKYDGNFWWDFSQHISSDQVHAIYQDRSGNFWIGTSDGLVKFIPDNNGPNKIVITLMPDDTIGYASPLFSFYGIDIETAVEKLAYACAVQETNSNLPLYWGEFSREKYFQVNPLLNGNYTFWVKARDSEGNESNYPVSSQPFTVDITPPTTIITRPVNEEIVSGIFSIYGTAIDNSPIRDFKKYWIEYAPDEDYPYIPDSCWHLIRDTVFTSVFNGNLADWDTRFLEKRKYCLKLTAEDFLKHQSSTVIKVTVVDTKMSIQPHQGEIMNGLANQLQLFFPPGCFAEQTEIYVSPLDTSEFQFNNLFVKKSLIAFNLQPEGIVLNKPARMSIAYFDEDIAGLAEKKLSLLRYQSPDNFEVIGGSIDEDKNIIKTVFKTTGKFMLIENSEQFQGISKISEVNIQPRIFSPRGSGYSRTATISFNLSAQSKVTIKVYNLSGRLIRVVLENEQLNGKCNAIEWDGRDYNGLICPSDLYIVTIQTGSDIKSKTVMILDKS